MPKSGTGWTGIWTVTFIDPTGSHPEAAARSQIYLFGDLYPEIIGARIFRVGQTGNLNVAVVSDVTNERESVTAATLSASVSDPTSGSSTDLRVKATNPGAFRVTYETPKDLAASEVFVTLRLMVTTASGIKLAPAVRVVPIEVRPPIGFPTVSPGALHLASLDNAGPTKATITIRADANSGGCVWLQAAKVDHSPRSAGNLEVVLDPAAGAKATCIAVPAGKSKQVTVAIDPADSGRGPVDGVLRLAAVSDQNGEQRETALPFDFAMTRPIDQAKRLSVFLALLVPGLLIPLLLAYAANWLTARFEPVRVLSSARMPVSITSGSVERHDHGTRLSITPDDFTVNVAPTPRRTRRLEHLGYRFRTRTSWNPFAAPRGESQRDGWLSSGRLGSAPTGSAARIGLALPGTWILSVPNTAYVSGSPASEAEGGPIEGELLVLSGDVGPTALDRLNADVHERVPGIARALFERAAEAAAQGETEASRTRSDEPAAPFDGGEPFDTPQGTPPRTSPATGSETRGPSTSPPDDEEPPWD
jgi:hypothetical protein